MAQNNCHQPSYALFQPHAENLSAVVFSPIQKYGRIKYTCFDVSPNYVAFGSSSGGIYLFQRNLQQDTLDYLYTIPSSEGRVTCISFSPEDDNLIAFATAKGVLTVVELVEESSEASRCLYAAKKFTSNPINIMKWDQFGEFRLFVGDEGGHIFLVNKIKSLTKLLVSPDPTPILRLDSKICQLDVSGDLVVASTLHRSVVHDIIDGSITQIGKKSRPSGEYGTCFFPREIQDNRVYKCIYAARPGSRLWEADLQGNVQLTHQFKNFLSTASPSPILTLDDNNSIFRLKPVTQLAPTFAKLFVISTGPTTLLMAYSTEPFVALYLIDPVRACIVLWTNAVENIEQIQCIGNEVFLLHSSKRQSELTLNFTKLTVSSLDECLEEYIKHHKPSLATDFLSKNREYFRHKLENHLGSSVTKSMIRDLLGKMSQTERRESEDIMLVLGLDRGSEETQRGQEETAFESEPSLSEERLMVSEREPISRNDSEEADSLLIEEITANYLSLSIYGSLSAEGMLPLHRLDQKLGKGIEKLNHGIGIVKAKVVNATNSMYAAMDQSQGKADDEGDEVNKQKVEHRNGDAVGEEVETEMEMGNDDEQRSELTEATLVEHEMEILQKELSINSEVAEKRCVCGFPRPESHLKLTHSQQKLQLILSKKLSGDKSEFQEVLKLAFESSLWPLYLKLLLQSSDHLLYIDVSLMLGDIRLLQAEDFVNNFVKKSDNGYDAILERYLQLEIEPHQQRFKCLSCRQPLSGTTITWDNLSQFLLLSAGTSRCMEVMKRFSDKVASDSVPFSFYLASIRSKVVAEYQSSMSRKKLQELSALISASSQSDTSTCSASGEDLEKRPENSRTFWGLSVNIGQRCCQKCNQCLSIPKESLVIFKCNHVYHKKCCTSRSKCQVCCRDCDTFNS